MNLNPRIIPAKLNDKGKAVTTSPRVLPKKNSAQQKMVPLSLNPQVIYVNASAPELQRAVKIAQEYSATYGKAGDSAFEEA